MLAIAAFAFLLVPCLWSSQVLIIGRSGVSLVIEPAFMAASLIIAPLFGAFLPLEVYAFRLAVVTASQTGGTVVGVVLGTASMTCCALVILPSILSLVGFSGTTILSLNGLLGRYWLPLATFSVILLASSLVSVLQALDLKCRMGP